jgi:hypothetical protein
VEDRYASVERFECLVHSHFAWKAAAFRMSVSRVAISVQTVTYRFPEILLVLLVLMSSNAIVVVI